MARAVSGRRHGGHGADDQFVAIGGDEHGDLEEIRGAFGSDDQPSVWILAEIFDDESCSIA
jgi:hypothetical protein